LPARGGSTVRLRSRRTGLARARCLKLLARDWLIDKITILEIKSERIGEPEKNRNVLIELQSLQAARDRTILPSDSLNSLTAELRAVNERLWDIEDEIRACERAGDFGPKFVELARSVYLNNDRRAAIKREINVLLGSKIIEEKSYAGTMTEHLVV
jgi:hypothetical protein